MHFGEMGKGRKTSNQEVKKLSAAKQYELKMYIQRLLKIDIDRKANNQELWEEYLELKKIADQFVLLETDLKLRTGSGGERMKNMPAFVHWVTENGGLIDNIEVAEYPGVGFGLRSKKGFAKDEAMITIPRKLFMSLDNPALLAEPYLTEIPFPPTINVKLAFWLIVEKLNPNSFYKAYIDILPERLPHFLQYTLAEMQELKGSSALAYTINQYKKHVRMFAVMHSFLQQSRHPSLELVRQRFTFELYW